jgi:Tol biopolymer transport system component
MALAAAGMAISIAAAPQKDASAAAQMQSAINKQTVEGDLKGAIRQYAAIAAKYAKTDRGVAATALVRMAECHQAMGDAEAGKIYEQVVREFADQPEAVREARAQLGSQRTLSTHGLTIRKLWSGVPSGTAAISSDGRYLVFADRMNNELGVRDLAAGESRVIMRLAADQPIGSEGPLWSPDGKRIAHYFKSPEGFQSFVVNLDGTGVRVLYRSTPDEAHAEPTGWSPDSKRILVHAFRKNGGSNIFWVRPADSGVERLRWTETESKDQRQLGFPFPSPDGRYIVSASATREGGHILLIGMDGSGGTFLSHHDLEREYPIGWTPDGSHVLFASREYPGLWAVPVASGKPQGPPVMVYDVDQFYRTAGMTRAGAFYFTKTGTTSDIYTATMDSGTGKVTSAPTPLPTTHNGSNFSPRWSPDGRRILYQWGHGTPAVRDVYVATLQSGTERMVAHRGELGGGGYCWSEDSGAVLFRSQSERIMSMPATGKAEPTVLPGTSPVGGGISCTLNGRLMAFRDDKERAVKVRNLASGAETTVYKIPEHLNAANYRTVLVPEISPDGSQVALIAQLDTTSTALMVTSASGGSPHELLRVKSPAAFQPLYGLSWSPDGRYVYYLKQGAAGAPFELFRVPAAGGQEESAGLKGADIRDINIAPDGKRIVFSIGGVNTLELWTLENFLPSAR